MSNVVHSDTLNERLKVLEKHVRERTSAHKTTAEVAEQLWLEFETTSHQKGWPLPPEGGATGNRINLGRLKIVVVAPDSFTITVDGQETASNSKKDVYDAFAKYIAGIPIELGEVP